MDLLLGLARPATIEIDGLTYWTATQERVDPPRADVVELAGLKGLVDFILWDQDLPSQGELAIRVSERAAVLFGRNQPKTNRRICWATAKPVDIDGPSSLAFGQWYSQEEFTIRVLAQFVESGDRAEVLRLSGCVIDEAVRTSTDDGITQEVVSKAGAKPSRVDVPNPFMLAPYRTFREVDQPVSPFILRIRNQGGIHLALFEADGGKWKLDAQKSVAEWLRTRLPGVKILT